MTDGEGDGEGQRSSDGLVLDSPDGTRLFAGADGNLQPPHRPSPLFQIGYLSYELVELCDISTCIKCNTLQRVMSDDSISK